MLPSSAAHGESRVGVLKPGSQEQQRGLIPTSSSSTQAIAARQQELQDAVSRHIEVLERTVVMREEEIAATYRQLAQLEEDYQFNLSLISERDEALQEASTDLSKAYGELSAIKLERDEACRLQESLEKERQVLRETIRHLESEREREWSKWRNEAGAQIALWEAKYVELEQKTKLKGEEEHTHYMALVAELEEERERLRTSRDASQQHYEASISELKKHHEEEQKRIQERLLETIKALEAGEQEKVALETRYQALQREVSLQQQRHAIALEAVQQGKVQEREELLKEMDERIYSVDMALRTAIAGRQEAEGKCEVLTARVATLEREAAVQTEEHQAAAAKWAATLQEVQSKVEHTESMCLAVEQERKAGAQQLEEECLTLRQELQQAKRAEEDMRHARDEWKEKAGEREREVERLSAEVEHWKAEEERTARRGKTNLLRTMERVQELEDAVEEMKETMREQQVRYHDITENAQGEASRLRQELHASEVARTALEEQFHLLRDSNKTQLLLESTQAEKEQLANRVMQLEHVNAEVRQQVATFTLELQNDPIIKEAKEYAVRIPELQRQLLEAQCERQVLQEKLQEREEELAGAKLQLLQRSPGFPGESISAPSLPHHTTPQTTTTASGTGERTAACSHCNMHTSAEVGTMNSHGHTCSSTLQQEHEVLRAMYENLRREVKANRARHARYLVRERMNNHRRPSHDRTSHRKRRGRVTKSGSSCTCSHSSSTLSSAYSASDAPSSSFTSTSAVEGAREGHAPSPPTPGGSTQRGPSESHHGSLHSSHRRLRRHRRSHRSLHHEWKTRTQSRDVSSSSQFSSSSVRHRRIKELEESVEQWQKKCLELEWLLQQTVQQRDTAKRQAAALELEKAALQRQIRSLTELNTFLKSQWRQQQDQRPILSSSLGSPSGKNTQIIPPPAVPSTSTFTAPSSDTAPTAAAAAALLRLLSSPSQLQQFWDAAAVGTAQKMNEKKERMGELPSSMLHSGGPSVTEPITTSTPSVVHSQRHGKESGGALRGEPMRSGIHGGEVDRAPRQSGEEEEPYRDRLRIIENDIAAIQYRIAKTSKRSEDKGEGSSGGGARVGSGPSRVHATSVLARSPKGGEWSRGAGASHPVAARASLERTRMDSSRGSRETGTDKTVAVRRGYGAVRHYGVV